MTESHNLYFLMYFLSVSNFFIFSMSMEPFYKKGQTDIVKQIHAWQVFWTTNIKAARVRKDTEIANVTRALAK